MNMLLLYQEEGAAEAEWADEPSEVAHLTDTTFDPFIAAHNSTLVMFYAPWYDRVSVFCYIDVAVFNSNFSSAHFCQNRMLFLLGVGIVRR